MSHKSIRKLIEDTAKSLVDDLQYSYGNDTDFNQDRKKSPVMINVAPLVSVPSYTVNGVQNYMKRWDVQMIFCKFDKEASSREDYSKILDDTDVFVDQFINQLNFFSAKSAEITLTFGNQQPFVKAQADILTGWLLTFSILAMDSFEYCEDC